MKRSLISSLLCVALIACASADPALDAYAQKLKWLDDADPQADAARAIAQGDLRLLGLALRAVSIPSVGNDEIQAYEQACGVKLIDGVSDVVRSQEHLRLMQAARSYALRYNAIIKTQCQP